MERIPILQIGEFLLVTIQVDMHDQLAMTLQDDLSERIGRLIDGDPSLVFDRIDTRLDRFASTIGGDV